LLANHSQNAIRELQLPKFVGLPLTHASPRMADMHQANKLIGFLLVAGIVSSTVDMGGLLRWIGEGASSKAISCPVHTAECRCPKACNALQKVELQSGCHRTDRKPLSGRHPCFLKAGCSRDRTLRSAPSTKDFLPEPAERLALQLNISLLDPFKESRRVNDDASTLFHPPRSS